MNKTVKNISKGVTLGLIGTVAAGIAAAVSWIFFSRKYIRHDMPLDEALEAERKDFTSQRAGKISYYVDKNSKGTPLVLLHSINAAPSAYEMKPIFEHFRGERPVYAVDLPGFGFSERSDRLYSPLLYQNAICDFLKDVVGKPADVVALSLSCEFAGLAAVHNPELFRSLVMISPTGFNQPRLDQLAEGAQQRGDKHKLYAGLAVPLWNRPIYDLIASRPSIQYFLNKSFEGLVPDSLVDYAYQTAHQPGAQFAPTYFLSGKLFTPAVRELVYKALENPVLVIYDRDTYTNFEMLPTLLRERDNWQAVRISPTKGLPHWEAPQRVSKAMADFWFGL
jgi:pimeloyl-ACP methyl ester carboxylesterase